MAFTFFFRDRQGLEAVRDLVVPSLRGRRFIRIWDAGCASGQEPYSLAIALREGMGPMIFRNVRIHATDIDHSNTFGDRIRTGRFTHEEVGRIPGSLLRRYFVPEDPSGAVRVKGELRNRVQFQKHDLLSLEPPRLDFDVIVCKNVLLHFRVEERVAVVRMFHEALAPGGFLLLEQTQPVPPPLANRFARLADHVQLYRKRESILQSTVPSVREETEQGLCSGGASGPWRVLPKAQHAWGDRRGTAAGARAPSRTA